MTSSPVSLAPRAAAVRRVCLEALDRPYMTDFRTRLEAAGETPEACVELIRRVGDDQASLEPVRALLARLGAGSAVAMGVGERFMVLQAILAHLPLVPGARLAPAVEDLVYDGFTEFAEHEARHDWCRAGTFSFTVAAKKATLRIFAGGEFYWEVSGFPRSWLADIPKDVLPRALMFFATRFKGFRPAYFFHLDPGRRVRALSPEGLDACYYRMAQCLERQPEVKGILTVGWLHSPDTHAVSPHLAWRNQTILEHSGFVSRIDRPLELPLVFHRSPERRKAYEAGTFTPTNGLVLWAAADMRRWARQHPELAERGAA